MSLGSTLNTVGFGLFALVFGALSALLGHFRDPCNIRNLPNFEGKLSADDCAAALAAPTGSGAMAADFVAFVTVIVRIEASLLLAMATGAAYQLTQSYEARKGAAFTYGIASVLCCLVDCNHAGLAPFYGSNPLMTPAIGKASIPLVGLCTKGK